MSFLGIDLSTQRIKATIINSSGIILYEENVHFDSELPHFHTKDGVYIHPCDMSVTTPTLLWVEALDLLLQKLSVSKLVDLASVEAISASGQQHGSVYWKYLPSLSDPSKKLHEIFRDAFTVQNSPIWMDMSTLQYCQVFESAVGSPQKLADLTGSSGYERFTGPQIAKIAERYPNEYAQTERISLVSSFVATLFLNSYAPIDPSDGSGMNLLNIYSKKWVNELLTACDQSNNLAEKLGITVGLENEILGTISPYFVNKYGFNPFCVITTSSGDNPCTLSSMPSSSGDLIISFGTSDTCMFVVDQPTPLAKAGHIFCNPNDSGNFMGLLCFRNGSLAREKIRDTFANGSWDEFNEMAKNHGTENDVIGLYFLDPEIQPAGASGYLYFAKNQEGKFDQVCSEPKSHCNAIIKSQTLLKKYFCEKLGLRPNRIIAVGGGAQNKHMIQTVANVFGLDVYRNTGSNSASLGACSRALFAKKYVHQMSYQEMMKKIHPGLELLAKPDMLAHEQFNKLGFDQLMKSHFHDK